MPKQRILIVDDSHFTAVATKQFLSEQYDVDTVYSGKECLHYLEKTQPDLIILDIQMPVMNGFETYSAIKEKGKGEIPVIFLTGNKDSRIVTYGLKTGAVDYILKPVQADVLRERVNQILPPPPEEEKHKAPAITFEKELMDTATGLPNDKALRSALDGMQNATTPATKQTLVYLSIDHLAETVGDKELLAKDYNKTLAEILRSVPDAMAFRLEHERFALLFSGPAAAEVKQACGMAQSTFVGSPVCIQNRALTLSFGGVVWDGAKSPEQLRDMSLRALELAAHTGGCVSLYE